MLGFYLKGLVAAVAAGALAGVVSAAAAGHVQVVWVVAAVLVVFAAGLVRGVLRRARTTYTITDRRLTIERGLLGREVHDTSLERVQNVRCRQSLLERMLGVGTVELDTAGGLGFDFQLRGVERPRQLARAIDRTMHARTQRLPSAS
jgi:uncharacterized membrane protein YdbT with pleckstrin-like domain